MLIGGHVFTMDTISFKSLAMHLIFQMPPKRRKVHVHHQPATMGRPKRVKRMTAKAAELVRESDTASAGPTTSTQSASLSTSRQARSQLFRTTHSLAGGNQLTDAEYTIPPHTTQLFGVTLLRLQSFCGHSSVLAPYLHRHDKQSQGCKGSEFFCLNIIPCIAHPWGFKYASLFNFATMMMARVNSEAYVTSWISYILVLGSYNKPVYTYVKCSNMYVPV